ncbi:putative helicase [Tetrabaena socialis]|uniref:Putative helicase n=1 Tax=Tetrabaena socialis TaxID=47790 RepID=A0A2J8AJ41_9CHLO|nr:putative helicase [Tetrabaena socialis]|eukprot:PNH12542.1 putative helicase [Tetrabaena socialis]
MKVLIVKTTRALQILGEADLDEFDVVLCTSTYYNRVIQLANANHVKFTRAIFDEIDNMNIPGCMKPDAVFIWFVTASYNNLINPRGCGKWNSRLNRHILSATGIRSMGFVKTLFIDMSYSMNHAMMKTLVVKNKDAFVIQSMSLSPITQVIVRCRTPMTINLLNGLVDKMLINFLNAGDIASALQFINPANKDTEENIVAALIDKYNRALRALDAKHAYMQSTGDMESGDDNVAELTRIVRKQQEMRGKIDCIRSRITTSNMCCICYEDLANKSVVPCCSNSYCLKCISTWLSQKAECPMCKAPLRVIDLLVVQGPSTLHNMESHPADLSDINSKAKNLEIILQRRSKDAKVLIFSSFDRALSNVGQVLASNNIKYSYLKGNQHQISSVLKQHSQGDLDVLLVNPANYGCGINMEKTTDIIMLHKFDTEIERQVIGRAHRYGRGSELRVWYLLYENECPVSS